MSSLWSRVPRPIRRLVAELPQASAAVEVAFRATAGRLRILAFHGVPDQVAFARLAEAVLERCVPVSGAEVAAALGERTSLPPRAVWFTFDDGEPSSLAAGRLLADLGVRATAFVCPSVVDTRSRLWFQTLAECERLSLIATSERGRFALGRLKNAPDEVRRSEVAVLEERLRARGEGGRPQATTADLRSWSELGHDVGNHTWSHPLLDHCSPATQVAEVRRAHDWLVDRGFSVTWFAYPNGNVGTASQQAVRRLGYRGGLLFDHRLVVDVARDRDLSRLKIDADVSIRRGLSIVSGAHSAAAGLALR